jgi:hypothetical protein
MKFLTGLPWFYSVPPDECPLFPHPTTLNIHNYFFLFTTTAVTPEVDKMTPKMTLKFSGINSGV